MRKAAGVEGRRGAARRGQARSFKSRIALAAAASLAVASIYAGEAEAKGIRGAKVTAGSASIRQKGPRTTIRAADRTIIRYDQFNVRKGESVRFVQPSKDARVLNRIAGAAPSRIDGRLNANGVVYFVNPAGVLFGRGSVLNVGALYASAGDVRDEDFLNGVNRFQPGPGRIENRGTIVGGAVHLSGGEVVNSGTIVAERGVVTMTSGADVFLADGEDSILVRVEPPAAGQRGTVRNAGEIRAGSVQLVGGSGVGDVYSIAVRNSGRIKAREITVDANAGVARVGGALDASSTTPGETGGSVKILGDKVAVTTAHVNASGAAGGGTVLVGGDFQGKGETPTASRTFVGGGATIAADATGGGDGGRVIVWSDEVTGFAGRISARGGPAGGNGGFVEVSGKQTLAFRGTVDVSAPKGTMGTLLLDPRDITIVDADGGSDDGELNDEEILFDDDDPPAQADETDFTISEETLEGINGTIILQAQRDVIVQDLATDGNLNLAAVNVGEALVIQAGRDITFNDPTNTITTAGGGVHVEGHSPHAPGHNPAGVGTLTLGNITTGGGDVTLIGNNFNLQGVIDAGAGNISLGRSVNGNSLRLGSAANAHLDDNEIDNLQTNGMLTLGRSTTAGDDGDGVGGLTRTAGTVIIDGVTFGSRDVTLVSLGTINDEDDAGNAITTTGTLTLTSGAAIGGAGGPQGLNTNINSLTVTSSGEDDITITNDGTQAMELTSVETGGIGNVVITQETNDITIPDDGVVTAGSVAVRALAGSINAALGSENNGVEEITGGGGVALAGTGIGDAPQVEISGGGALVIESAGTAEVDVEVIATPFDSVTITQADRRADLRVSLPGTDLVEIHGTTTAATEGLTNDVLLFTVDTGAGVDFDYTLSDAAGNVLVRSDNVFARGDFALSSAGDVRLGDVAGVAIDADAGRDVTLTADGAIVNNGGSIAMDGGDLTLSAGTSIGSAATPIATTGSHGLRADAALGGVFITNGTSGTVTVNGTGVSGAGAPVELRNAAGALVIAAGGVSTTGAGTITLEGQGISQTGGTIGADTGAIVIDGNDGTVTTGAITTNAAGNAVRVIDTDTLAVNGPMSAANGAVVLGEGGAGDRIGGSITQNASGVITADVLVIDSAAGSIDLNGALNLIATLGAVSRNGRLRLTNDGALTIAAPLTGTTITNELTIQTDNGALTINADVFTSGANNISLAGEGITLAPGVTINAGTGTITLDGNDGAIDLAAGSLLTDNATSSAITLRDATTITLGTTTAAAGGLVLGIGQDVTGAVAQAAGTGINVNAVSASTGGAITLDSATNAINTLGAVTRGGALTVRDAGGGLTLGGPVTSGTTTNAVDIATAGGVLAVTGNVSTGGANDLSLSGLGVTLAAGGTIDGGAGRVLIDGGGGAIDLGSGIVITTNAGGSAITVRDATTVALGNTASANGTLVIGVGQDVTGDVTQNAGMLVNAGTVTASTGGAIALDGAANTIGSLGPVTRGGALTVRDAVGGLTIGGAIDTGNIASGVDVQTAGGALGISADVVGTDVTLTGTGLTQAAGSTVTATGSVVLDGNAGTIDLDGAVSGGTAITVRDGSVTSVGTLSSPLGAVNLGVARDITGPLTQSGPIVAAALNVSTNNSVALENASNNIATLVAENAGTFAYADADGFTATDVDSSGGDIFLSALTGELVVGTLDAGAGDIVLTADDMDLAGGANSIAATGDLTLRPVSAARDITIGVGAAGGLSLDDTELAALQDGFRLITIGRVADGTGTVTVTSATLTDDASLVGGSIVLGLLDVGDNDATLTARVAGIADSTGGGGSNVVAQTVTLSAVTGIGGSGPAARLGLDTPVATATNTTSGGIFLDGVAAGGITFSAIDAQTSGSVELTSAGSATLTFVITADGSVAADAVGLLDVVSVTANGNPNGNVTLQGGAVTIDTVTARNDATVTSDGAITAATVTATQGDATLSAGTSVEVGIVSAAGTAALSAANGSITAAAPADPAADVVAQIIDLSANGGTIGTSAAPLEIDASILSAGTNDNDIFLIDTAGGVAVGLVNAGTAGVSVTTIDGSLTSAAVDGAADVVGGSVTLATTGVGNEIGAGNAQPLEINAATIDAATTDGAIALRDTAGGLAVGLIDAGDADIDLNVVGGNLKSAAVDGAADVLGRHVRLTLTGGSTIGIDETNALEIAADTLEALTNDGDVFVRQQDRDLVIRLVNAGLGNVTLIVEDAGSITSETVDGVADVIADHVTLRTLVDGSIGVDGDNPLEVNAATLTASATSADVPSQIFVLDTLGGVAVANVAAGEVKLTANNGGITSASVDGVADITAADLTLRVSGAGSDIGAGAGGLLEIDADTLTGATGGAVGDDIFVLDIDGGVAIDSLDAGLGNVHLTTANGGITGAAPGAAADIVGGLVDLEIVGTGNIGASAADPLRIEAAILNADASAGGGDIFITDLQGGVAVGLVTAGAGDVVLRAEGGSIASQTVDAAADIVGNRVDLSATGNARTIGASAGSRLEINATELHASTEDGAIFVSDTAGGVSVGAIDAGGQDVQLSATGGSIADDGNDATSITAGGLFLDVGAAHGIGALNGAGAIDTAVNSLTANAGTGGIFVQESSGITLSAVTAQGEVRVTALAGNIAVNTVTTAADRQVRLAAPAGAITDGNGAATNVAGGHLRFTAQGQINLDTAASILTAASDAGNVNLREIDGATLRSVVANDGNVTVSTAAGDLEVEVVGADGTATLTAGAGSIFDDGDDATEVAGDEVVLGSGPAGSIGAAGTLPDIDTRGGTITASAGSGGAFLTEADGAAVTANVTGSGLLRIRNGGGTVVIAGASGSEDGDVSMDTEGAIRISAPLTSDTGDISLDADLVTDVRSAVNTANGNVTFGANRNGDVSLRANVSAPGDGTVTFTRDVSVDGDARVRAGRAISFERAIDGDSALTLDGGADADVTLNGAVGADGPLASLTIDGRNINLRDVTVVGDVTLSSAPQVVTGLPAGLITLDGDVRSINGNVRLNADGRADVPTVATIAAAGDVTVSAGANVLMGRNEKFTAIGDLTIEAGGDAVLGDLTALNTLAIDAGGEIRLLLRAPGGVRAPGAGVEQDDGLDLIGGDGIELDFGGGRIIFDGVGAAPRFASNNGIGLDRQDLAGLQTFALTTPVSAATLSDGTITLDGRVDGRIFAIVPVIAPKEARQAQLEAGVGAGMLTDLEEIGVNVKILELDQLIQFLERLVVYDDVPPEMAAVPRDLVEPNRYLITRNRISFRVASQVVKAYYDVFFVQPPPGADPQSKPKSRSADIRQKIEDAIADYRTKLEPAQFDPLAFRRFVEETPAHAEALGYLNGIRELFVMIQPIDNSEAGGGLGLTPAEAAVSRQVILSKLGVTGADQQELESAIFGAAAPVEEQK